MSRKDVHLIAGVVLITACMFAAGVGIGWHAAQGRVEAAPYQSLLRNLPVGSSVEITMDETTTPARESSKGESVGIKSNRDYWRGFSWFGLGGPEAAVKDQGFTVGDSGSQAAFGQQKGYGILEQLWNTIKSFFWVGIIGLLVLVALTFIPATAAIAGTILRGLASLVPVLGSVVEKIVAVFHWKTPFVETVAGGQLFKSKVRACGQLTLEQQTLVIQMFTDAMRSEQDGASQTQVQAVKATLPPVAAATPVAAPAIVAPVVVPVAAAGTMPTTVAVVP